MVDQQVPSAPADVALAAMSDVAPVDAVRIRASERVKSLATVERLARQAVDAGVTRRSCVVAIGGGLIGNIAGLLAALLFRGVRLVHVPTTLLAASDSTLSLKQAVNLAATKNIVGTYYAPSLVWVDLDFLTGLPSAQLRSALCEVAKNVLAITPHRLPDFRSVVRPDVRFTPDDLARIVEICVEVKSAVIADDPREAHQALILEYGHTVGHALEMTALGGLPHGYAVGLGMVTAAGVASRCGMLADADVSAHTDLLAAIGAPVQAPCGIVADDVLRLVRRDNKRGLIPTTAEHHAMVLLTGLGRPAMTGDIPLVPVPDRVLRSALDSMLAAPR